MKKAKSKYNMKILGLLCVAIFTFSVASEVIYNRYFAPKVDTTSWIKYTSLYDKLSFKHPKQYFVSETKQPSGTEISINNGAKWIKISTIKNSTNNGVYTQKYYGYEMVPKNRVTIGDRLWNIYLYPLPLIARIRNDPKYNNATLVYWNNKDEFNVYLENEIKPNTIQKALIETIQFN